MRICALRTMTVQYLFMAEKGSVRLVRAVLWAPKSAMCVPLSRGFQLSFKHFEGSVIEVSLMVSAVFPIIDYF